MPIKSDNITQFIHDVREASGKEIPDYPDYYNLALDRGDKKMVDTLNRINENDFRSIDKLYNSLETNIPKEHIKKSWVAKISKKRKVKELSVS